MGVRYRGARAVLIGRRSVLGVRAWDGNLVGDLGVTVARAESAEGTKLPGGVAWSVKGGATCSERVGERSAGKGRCVRAGPSAGRAGPDLGKRKGSGPRFRFGLDFGFPISLLFFPFLFQTNSNLF